MATKIHNHEAFVKTSHDQTTRAKVVWKPKASSLQTSESLSPPEPQVVLVDSMPSSLMLQKATQMDYTRLISRKYILEEIMEQKEIEEALLLATGASTDEEELETITCDPSPPMTIIMPPTQASMSTSIAGQ